MNSIKLCIAGSFGFKDIGDEAMLTAHLNFLRDTVGLQRDHIYLFGELPEYISEYHQHPLNNCLSSRRLMEHACVVGLDYKGLIQRFPRLLPRLSLQSRRIAQSASGLLITGGGTINTRDDVGESLFRLHGIIQYFKSLGKPIFLSGQTIGPLGLHKAHDQRAKAIVNAVDFLSVRDSEYSRRYLKAIGSLRSDLVETVDDAFDLDYSRALIPDEVQRFICAGRPVAAVNVTEYTSEAFENRAFMAELCEWLIARGRRVILVAHTPKDYFRLGMIYDMIRNPDKPSVCLPDTRNWRGEDLKLLISKCSMAVGGRYHFIIFCATTGTPFIGMCGNHYSYIKQNGMAKPLGMEDSILTEKETFDSSIIYPKLETLLKAHRNPLPIVPNPMPSFSALHTWLKGLSD